MKRNLFLLLACLATQIALGEPSLAEKSAAENAAIKKEWESWNAPPFWTAVASEARHRFLTHRPDWNFHTPHPPESAVAAGALPAQSKTRPVVRSSNKTPRHWFEEMRAPEGLET